MIGKTKPLGVMLPEIVMLNVLMKLKRCPFWLKAIVKSI